MDIQVIKIQEQPTSCSLDSTRIFGLCLNKALTKIKMVHWYILCINAHKIVGDLYEDLTNLIDKLQEEIIGTSRVQKFPFPQISNNLFETDDLNQFQAEQSDILFCYYDTTQKITNLLCSQEFNTYINSVTSGLNNTKEEILSAINKSNYLLSLLHKT